MISVVISRALLSLSDLTITDDPTSGTWVPEDGLGRPGMAWRSTYADPSPFYAGQVLTSAVLEQTNIALSFYVRDTTTANIATKQAAIEAAFSQFAYTVTITEDGVARVWTADPASWSWGDADSAMVRAKLARGAFTVPVYPVSA